MSRDSPKTASHAAQAFLLQMEASEASSYDGNCFSL